MSENAELTGALEYHVANTLGWYDLRPLQKASIEPVRSGADCLLIAPTAGGKTEAATFPVLSRMVDEEWQGLSVIYFAPLKALLNNLLPRLEQYTAWLGRRVALWHGDVGDGERRRILSDPPDILLTTPESLEAMLVSRRVEHHLFFRSVRALIADEVHAFAASDRGWHLVAVLERLQRLCGQRIQRIGLSATLGNPDDVLRWLQGSNVDAGAPARVVVGEGGLPVEPDVTLDFVGSVDNAATVLSQMFLGEKRLVFCESRSQAEELAFALRSNSVETYVSHSSLSVDERRRSERAFAEGRDCVIVATSTLELGIDIGDLDRMIQLDSPRSVSSFLQRLGRTGRRAGSVRNALFLATDNDTLLRAAGMLHLWGTGFVEPVVPPPSPRHIAAQQLLALALQEGRFARASWHEWWAGSHVMDGADEVLDYLVEQEFLAADGPWLFIGPRAEKEFGRRHFLELLSTFIADLEMKVIEGRREIGSIAPLSLTTQVIEGRKPLLLAGRAWIVESIDWDRHVIVVREDLTKGRVRWGSEPMPESFEMVRARRDVLLGADPSVRLSQRAVARLAEIRTLRRDQVVDDGLVLERGDKSTVLWAFGGLKAHATLLAALPGEVADSATADNETIRFNFPLKVDLLDGLSIDGVLPEIAPRAVDGLNFSVALPDEIAMSTVASRYVDDTGALTTTQSVIVERRRD
ncbi:DEAD/DEAH box helicase [Microbacterium imperiale]|uniref:ATP-dependent helicase n=1 Tax=Microbacterium imperiale TaxID=33884 RepID=A0A9W6M4E3_9MICO|nr:DEAD/DEAH box helicase [Microbacterium imperiale]MBP2421542.1 ATP-dependent Lhr-like helicase [Microbacterium imperiale]MDS0199351.1 DEAD/DEAH box helicase [Microbacterium imperiale]BFE41882.1 DEAD/DEAH box helicase [Microbacterium imperiale]GLJ80834.1 ATP-dependent helicase [Microbacterium imperiale]